MTSQEVVVTLVNPTSYPFFKPQTQSQQLPVVWSRFIDQDSL